VARQLPVAAADLDADGLVTGAALERWIVDACDAYLERCTVLRAFQEQAGLERKLRIGARPDASRLGDATAVLVSSRATEFLPDALTIAVRVRSADGVVDTTCTFQLHDAAGSAAPLTDEIRDELIALEHAASHTN
jgi:acyl-CoA thioesterase FadM